MYHIFFVAILYLATPFLFLWLRKKYGKKQRLIKGSLLIDILLIIAGVYFAYDSVHTSIQLNDYTNGSVSWVRMVFDALFWVYAGFSLLLFDFICTFPKK